MTHGFWNDKARYVLPTNAYIDGINVAEVVDNTTKVAALKTALEYVMAGKSPLNNTALDSAPDVVKFLADFEATNVITLAYPVLDEAATLKNGTATQKGDEEVIIFRSDVATLRTACKDIQEAAAASEQGEKAPGSTFRMSYVTFVPANKWPNNKYTFGNPLKEAREAGTTPKEATARTKAAGDGLTPKERLALAKAQKDAAVKAMKASVKK